MTDKPQTLQQAKDRDMSETKLISLRIATCPLCGCDVDLYRTDDPVDRYHVECCGCGLDGNGSTRQEAVNHVRGNAVSAEHLNNQIESDKQIDPA